MEGKSLSARSLYSTPGDLGFKGGHQTIAKSKGVHSIYSIARNYIFHKVLVI